MKRFFVIALAVAALTALRSASADFRDPRRHRQRGAHGIPPPDLFEPDSSYVNKVFTHVFWAD